MMSKPELLVGGLSARAALREAFEVAEPELRALAEAGLRQETLDALYPFDFKEYLPALIALLSEEKMTKALVTACYAGGKLSYDKLDELNLGGDELDAFHAEFDITSGLLDDLYETVIHAYTDGGSDLPMPQFGRSPWDQAHAEVGYLLTNLALSAWLLARWQRVLEIDEPNAYLKTLMGSIGLQNLRELTLATYDRLWVPLITKQLAASAPARS